MGAQDIQFCSCGHTGSAPRSAMARSFVLLALAALVLGGDASTQPTGEQHYKSTEQEQLDNEAPTTLSLMKWLPLAFCGCSMTVLMIYSLCTGKVVSLREGCRVRYRGENPRFYWCTVISYMVLAVVSFILLVLRVVLKF